MTRNEAYEEFVYREGYRRGKAERHKMLDDGTLVVSVDDATAVTRVLVEDSEKNGDLYYADRPKGEWIGYDSMEDKFDDIRCSCCQRLFTVDAYHFTDIGFTEDDLKFCPNCGADMRGEDNE